MYNDVRAEGCKIPIVGSTDSHSVLGDGHILRSTVVFAENDNIIGAVSDGYSVAVESLPGENIRVYGSLRLVSYTHFLLENYFPIHDELCSASGLFLEEYVHGNEEIKTTIEQIEEKITSHEKNFFYIN